MEGGNKMNDYVIIMQATMKACKNLGVIFIIAGLIFLSYIEKKDKAETFIFKHRDGNTTYKATKMDKYYKVSWFENGKEVEVLYPIADVERYLREGFWIPKEVE